LKSECETEALAAMVALMVEALLDGASKAFPEEHNVAAYASAISPPPVCNIAFFQKIAPAFVPS